MSIKIGNEHELINAQNPSFFLYGPGEAKYGDQAIPTLDDPHDVIIRINYVGVCGSDVSHFDTLCPPSVQRSNSQDIAHSLKQVHWWVHGAIGAKKIMPGHPLVMGHEASGTIHSVGSAVKSLGIGDRVAMEPGFPCRRCARCKEGRYNLCKDMTFAATPGKAPGTLCKYFKLPEDFCFKLPEHVSLEEGVLVEPTSVAVHMARLVNIKQGDSVVVFGAGTVGLLSGAVAKAFGAEKVVLVDILQRKLDFAKTFVKGCGTFIPDSKASAEKNAAKIIEDFGLGDGADIVMEASGAEPSVQTGVHVARVGGSYVQAGLGRPNITFPIVVLSEKELTMKGCFRYSTGDFKLGLSLISEGKIPVKDLITKMVNFDQATDAWETTRKGEGVKTLIRGVQDTRASRL